MVPQYNTHLKFIQIILLFSIAGGCTSLGSTKQNEPYSGSDLERRLPIGPISQPPHHREGG
jgi:hypothetical protein